MSALSGVLVMQGLLVTRSLVDSLVLTSVKSAPHFVNLLPVVRHEWSLRRTLTQSILYNPTLIPLVKCCTLGPMHLMGKMVTFAICMW